jgi:hypothetical protein
VFGLRGVGGIIFEGLVLLKILLLSNDSHACLYGGVLV